MTTLGGTIILRNTESLDYSWREAIECLKELCDEVVVLDCGSNDGTEKLVSEYAGGKVVVVCLDKSEWDLKRKELSQNSLAYFTNLAASFLNTEWHFNLQADECAHEWCYDTIRDLINNGGKEGYWARRINLWGNSQHQLNVTEDRLPVGDMVLRLCKTGYQSVVDAQSIHCPDATFAYLEQIRIYHTGFIRNKYKHIEKINYMIKDIFHWDMDKKIEAMSEGFDPFVHFSKEDIIPIKEPLPRLIQRWCKERDRINGVKI